MLSLPATRDFVQPRRLPERISVKSASLMIASASLALWSGITIAILHFL